MTDEDNYSDSFDTNSTTAADGTVTTTGSGSSHNFISGDFSFSGGGSATQVFVQTPDTGLGYGDVVITRTLTESGSQVNTSDLTTTWVLDPNGNWRAANVQDVETGESTSNAKAMCK